MVGKAVTATLSTIALCLAVTVHATQVDPKGDQDNDGVVNERDQCANTPQGAAVDRAGCPTKISRQEHFEQVILFEKNSARPLQTEYTKVDKLAAFAKSRPNHFVLVEGFRSKAEPLETVDKERTDRVVQMLLEKGISRAKIRTANAGDHTPMVEGDSPAIHAANQRVYVRITTTITDHEKKFSVLPTKTQ